MDRTRFYICVFLFFIGILASSTCNAGSYTRYNFDYVISVEIPEGWDILDYSTTRQLDNATEALTGASQSDNHILIAADCITKYDKPYKIRALISAQ